MPEKGPAPRLGRTSGHSSVFLRRRLILPAALLCLFCAFIVRGCGFLPSDGELEANFLQREADFNKLAMMAAEDSRFIRIAPTFVITTSNTMEAPQKAWPDAHRWETYERLFKALDLQGGIQQGSLVYPGAIFFIASTGGWANGGSHKGYLFSTRPPIPIVESLDMQSRIDYVNDTAEGLLTFKPPQPRRTFPESVKDTAETAEGLFAFKPIKPNWYLFYWEG